MTGTGSTVEQDNRERAACPVITGDRLKLARRGINDAQLLVGAVRQDDMVQVFGQLELWRVEDPIRHSVATVALAAMVDPDVTPSKALAWCDHLCLPADRDVREMRAA